MRVLHVLDSWNIGGIQEMALNLHKFSRHAHASKGYAGTMTPYMLEAGMSHWGGMPVDEELYPDVIVGHTVGGWKYDGDFQWAHERGIKTIECMHSIAQSPTTPSSVDAFVAVSHLAEQRNGHMPNRHVIYPIVDVDSFQIEGPRYKIGKLCRLADEKQPLQFVEIARQFPEEQFVLAGDGPLMAQVQAMRPPNLEVLGMIRKFPEFYASLKLFVFPTRDECCSVAVAMAQAAGVPIIVQNIPALVETTGKRTVAGFQDNIEGFVGATRFALDHLEDEDMLAYQQAEIEWVREHFAPEVTVMEWDKLCESLTNGI